MTNFNVCIMYNVYIISALIIAHSLYYFNPYFKHLKNAYKD